MADISLIQDDLLDSSDDGLQEHEDVPSVGQMDDDTLPPLLRIQKYALSKNVFDRQMVPRVVLELFITGTPEHFVHDLPRIMNIISKLAEDEETMVRADLLEQIPSLSATIIECSNRIPELSGILSDHLLPLVVRNLSASDIVRKTAHSTLYLLLEKGFVTRQQAEILVCPTVLNLPNMDSVMDSHTTAISLMSKLSHFLGQEITERVFLQRFTQLCSNPMFYVRKFCASHFGDFCAVIGKEAYENILFPCYLTLCGDDIWGVRKACADVVMSVSYACSPVQRRSELAPVFIRLLEDQSRWVRMSAFHTLGPFISTFADPPITKLAYNTVGELVVVNNEGTEFRYTRDMRMNISQSRDLLNGTMNLFEFYDDDRSSKDCKEIKLENVDVSDIIYKKVSNYVDDDGWRLWECRDNVLNSVNLEVDKAPADDCTDSKENSVESNLDSESSGTADWHENKPSNTNVIHEIQSNSCDNLDKSGSQTESECSQPQPWKIISLNDIKDLTAKFFDSLDPFFPKDQESHSKNENIEQYNSYNYWYISPDIPLDPSLLNVDSVPPPIHTVTECTETWSPPVLTPKSTEVEAKSATPLPYPKMDVPWFGGFRRPKPDIPDKPVNTEEFVPRKQPPVLNKKGPAQHIVPQQLINHFVSMTDPVLAQSTDNEMAFLCAYSLPAVALTLGNKNWYLLEDTLEALAANMQYKVRRTVASSLHELAIILGTEIATRALTPIFDGFLKDLDEVRIGVLKHLAHFLRLIDPSKRSIYLPKLAQFLQTDNEANWRFRHELAEQLLLAVSLFRPGDATKHISILAQELLCDKVAAVREIALLLVTELIRHISTDQFLTSRLLVKLAEKFAHSKRWKLRQSFALLCSELLTSDALRPDQFTNEVMPHLLDLSWDPVANVRLVVARTISQHIVTNDYFTDVSGQHYDGLQTVLRRLQSDTDRDVRHSAVFERR